MSENSLAGTVVPMRTDKFRTAFDGARTIASKTLPTDSETKMSLIVASYTKIFDATTTVIKKIEDKHGRVVGRMTVLDAAGIKRRDRVMATILKIRLPAKLINSDDLPKKSDGDDDVQNRAATAMLVAALGPFYDHRAKGADAEMLALDADEDMLASLNAAAEEADDDPKPGVTALVDAVAEAPVPVLET